jgi:hypothetical protein
MSIAEEFMSVEAPGLRTSIVRHVGRRSGRTYPYGERTDWAKNVRATVTQLNNPRGITLSVITGLYSKSLDVT